MTEHLGADELNDLLDGILPSGEEAAIHAHLAACPGCSAEAAELGEALEGLRGLPAAATPPVHLWAGIQRRIERREDEGGGGAEVLPFPSEPPAPRRLSLTLPQLVAAAAVVALLSAGIARVVPGGRTAGMSTPGGVVVESPAPGGGAARAASAGQEGYDQLIGELELLVEGGRDVLAPETLATLEGSLATVDAALAEVRVALEEDPGSDLLRRMLLDHRTTKIRVLRQAVTALETRS